jgi:hypothetical protein
MGDIRKLIIAREAVFVMDREKGCGYMPRWFGSCCDRELSETPIANPESRSVDQLVEKAGEASVV